MACIRTNELRAWQIFFQLWKYSIIVPSPRSDPGCATVQARNKFLNNSKTFQQNLFVILLVIHMMTNRLNKSTTSLIASLQPYLSGAPIPPNLESKSGSSSPPAPYFSLLHPPFPRPIFFSPFPFPMPYPSIFYYLSLPFPYPLTSSLCILSSPPLPGGPIPLVQLRVWGSAVSSPTRSRESPNANRFAVHFERKNIFGDSHFAYTLNQKSLPFFQWAHAAPTRYRDRSRCHMSSAETEMT